MSSQLDRNQEIWDNIQYLQKKVLEIEAFLQDLYDREYDDGIEGD